MQIWMNLICLFNKFLTKKFRKRLKEAKNFQWRIFGPARFLPLLCWEFFNELITLIDNLIFFSEIDRKI